MRHVVTKKFEQFIFDESNSILKVAVVGGSSKDPEVMSISKLSPGAEFHYFNLSNDCNDNNFHFLDLNKGLNQKKNSLKFDLVLSSQVIEHIWNHDSYFRSLVELTNEMGIIWVSCPKSNMVHGAPDYFSAGFTASYLARNLERYGCEILLQSEVGNKRYYLGIHLGRYWQTQEENLHPLWRYSIKPGSFLGNVKKFIKDLPTRLLLSFIKTGESTTEDFATESFVAARVRNLHKKGKK